MNFLRQLLAIFAGKPKPAAAAAASPAPEPAVPPHRVQPVAGCSCAICAGKIDPRYVMRLTNEIAVSVDAALIGVSVGKIKAATRSIVGITPGGVASCHIIVCNDGVFSKLQNVLRDEPQ